MGYAAYKEKMKQLCFQQEQENRSCQVSGKRYWLPLNGRKIEIICYKKRADAPLLFCAYGGGFALGACALDDTLWKTLHQELDVTVVSIGYRKAPEYPFPCALYDVYETILYIEEHSTEFDIQSQDYSVYGNSAGGNLAAAVCMMDQKLGGRLHIRRQILNYPYCDLATEPEEKGHTGEELWMYQMFVEYYCTEKEKNNPLVSLVKASAEDLKFMPRAIISLADNDPLHAEGARYVSKLRAAGIEVACHFAPEMGHGYSETFFQGVKEGISAEVRKQFEDGSLKRETFRTIEFIKENF